MKKQISCEMAAASLSEVRTDIELSKFLGIAYSTASSWGNYENYHGDKRFQNYIIEYFKRLNITTAHYLMQKYDLPSDNDADVIAECFIPEQEVKALLVSKVEWKQKAMEMMLSMNRDLFIKQSKIIKLMVASQNKQSDVPIYLTGEITSNVIPFNILNADVSELALK